MPDDREKRGRRSVFPQPPPWVRGAIASGLVIPAHPLALTAEGQFDERHMRALTRYYAAAGAGGVAVAVHTTQFEIRDPDVLLLEPVLSAVARALNEIEAAGGARLVRVAGVCGKSRQAAREAELAAGLGYHAALISLAALPEADTDELIAHCVEVAKVLPPFGFYLQRAVGGRRLGFDFWRRFAGIPNAVGVKIAPFNRYETLDVVRGIAAAGATGRIALYTGNDDNIVADLLTRYDLTVGGRTVQQRLVGGLLGHWAVWTAKAADLHRSLRGMATTGWPIPADVLATGAQVTDANAALFDAEHDFAGCIAGIQHVLHRQGLLASPRCLDPDQTLSPGQADEIERVRRDYPHLIDDDFVAKHLKEWLV